MTMGHFIVTIIKVNCLVMATMSALAVYFIAKDLVRG